MAKESFCTYPQCCCNVETDCIDKIERRVSFIEKWAGRILVAIIVLTICFYIIMKEVSNA